MAHDAATPGPGDGPPAPGPHTPGGETSDGEISGEEISGGETSGGRIDLPRAEAAVRELLLAIGEDPDRDGLEDTPGRVARAYREMLAGRHQDPGEILARRFRIDHDEMVLVRDIEVFSLCEHHLLPFHGVAHVGYIPARGGLVTGLSKLARLVDCYAKRLQVQERLTAQVADALVKHLQARGVIVVVEAEHLCMSMRGVKKPGSRTTTSAVRGALRDPATRAEAMSLVLHSDR